MASKSHPLSAAPFPSAPFSFSSASLIFFFPLKRGGTSSAQGAEGGHGAGNAHMKKDSALPSSASTPGDFLLLNNALNEI